jgi:hypothetical protein
MGHPLGVPKIHPIFPHWGILFSIHYEYAGRMNALLNLRVHLHPSRRLTLVIAERYERQNITELITALCLRGPLHVLAGSDWLPSYGLTRLIRHQTHEVKQTLKHVRMARAFTCYQLLDLIANIRPDDEPLLILDFLNTFQDDDIPLPVRFRVLRQCCAHLQRLAFRKPVVIFAQGLKTENDEAFFSILAQNADEVLRIEAEPERVRQPVLF